jgi:putative hydrolase of the HAD superfamily
MIKGVIFDFDNTIYNYDDINNLVLKEIFNEGDLILLDEISSNIKKSNNYNNKYNKIIYFKEFILQKNLPVMHLYKLIDKYDNLFLNKIKLNDDVLELFNFLKSKDIKIIILSNNNINQQLQKIKQLNIAQYIDYIFTQDEIGESKPQEKTFNYVSFKTKIDFKNLVMIGDSYEQDIEPCLNLNILSFIYINNFKDILDFFINYYKNLDEYLFISKIFGQETYNIQGKGGNISVKFNDYIIIKSSGVIQGNCNYNYGYTLLDMNADNILIGDKESMEYNFHKITKKYTVHIHYTPINKYLCSRASLEEAEHLDNNQKLINILTENNINYVMIDYFSPGKELANNIRLKYTNEKLILLKNHGIIITSDRLDDLIETYYKINLLFNNPNNNNFDINDTGYICEIYYHKFNQFKIIKKYDRYIDKLVYTFPDLAVFFSKVTNLDFLDDLPENTDILNFNNNSYLICNDMIEYYCKKEMLDEYFKLNNNLIEINNINTLINSKEEKYRINKN